jgi:hypothetical protein
MGTPSVIFKTLDDGRYFAADAERGIEFRVDRLHQRFGETVGELSVSSGILSARSVDGILSTGTFNFSAPRERDSWSKRLAMRARTNGKLDWFGLLEELSQLVLSAERGGHTPAVILRTVPRRPSAPMFDVLGLRFPKEHPACIFGPGDSLKSYLMLAIANEQARAGVRVAIFDWELDAHEHRDRQARIDPELPEILYVKCDKPLVHDVDRLRRIVRAHRIRALRQCRVRHGRQAGGRCCGDGVLSRVPATRHRRRKHHRAHPAGRGRDVAVRFCILAQQLPRNLEHQACVDVAGRRHRQPRRFPAQVQPRRTPRDGWHRRGLRRRSRPLQTHRRRHDR